MDLTRTKKYKQKEKPSVDLSTIIYGKVPPQAKDLERAILGAIMLDKDAIDTATELLKLESFYLDAHQRIYKAILTLNSVNQGIDILTVTEALRTAEDLEFAGGPYYVTQLTNDVVSSANVEKYCRIVQQKYLQREMIKISGNTIARAYEDQTDAFDLISDHEAEVTKLTMGSMGRSYTPIDYALVGAVNWLEGLRDRGEEMTGVPSGFTELDRLTGGWQQPDLIILAARPAVGKTALALQFARHAAMNHVRKVPVAFFSLEMSTQQLVLRIMSAESEIPLEKLTRGRMDNDDMKQLYRDGIQKLAKASIFIDDTAGLTIVEFRARARRLKKEHNVGLIIIDYLQLMSGTGGVANREQEISNISRGLKMVAKELELPIIALSQLSRAVETRKGDNKIPQLSDLRESGAIEQDADLVAFIYRPEYYDINTNAEGESTKGETHVKIAKHRNGTLDTIKLVADLSIQRFTSWDYSSSYEFRPKLEKNEGWKPTASWYEKEKDDII
jgi:replicative DNA helicase